MKYKFCQGTQLLVSEAYSPFTVWMNSVFLNLSHGKFGTIKMDFRLTFDCI